MITNTSSTQRDKGFSLIEVVLAIGIFLVTVLALVGLLGPTLQSVDEVEKTDEVSSVVNTLNAFLQSSPDINPGGSKFNAIFNAVANDDQATIFIYRYYLSTADSNGNPVVRLAVGFADTDGGEIDAAATVDPTTLSNVAGPIYRVVLTPSSVIPESGTNPLNGTTVTYRSTSRVTSTNTYTLTPGTVAGYHEGYFAMEVRIFAMEADMVVASGAANAMPTPTLAELKDVEPIFTYNAAVVR